MAEFDILGLTLRRKRERVLNEIRSELLGLKHKIDYALKATEDGEQVNAHLISNVHMVTALIAEWNLLVEIMPCLEES